MEKHIYAGETSRVPADRDVGEVVETEIRLNPEELRARQPRGTRVATGRPLYHSRNRDDPQERIEPRPPNFVPAIRSVPPPPQPPAITTTPADEFGGDQPSLKDLCESVWRKKWMILSFIVCTLALTVIFLLQAPVRYGATALIALESGRANIHAFEGVLGTPDADGATLATEVETLRSRSLTGKVIDKLGLELKGEQDERPDSFANRTIERIGSALAAAKGWLVLSEAAAPRSQEDLANAQRRALIDAVRDTVVVKHRSDTRLIEVSVINQNPDTAAAIANQLADTYIADQVSFKYSTATKATRVLEQQVAEQREKVKASELAVDQYRKQAGLLDGERGGLSQQQVSELSSELVLARSARAEAEARWEQMKSYVDSSGANDSVFAGFDSPLLESLRQRKAELRLQKEDFERRYNAGHPDMDRLTTELADLQAQISSELRKISRRAENEFEVARSREQTLNESLQLISERVTQSNTDEVQLGALEREAESNRNLLNSLLERLNETASQDDIEIQQPDARVIAPAAVPEFPSFPNKKMILVLAVLVSGLLGTLVALASDLFDSSFRSGDEIRRSCGATTLALVPFVAPLTRRLKAPHQYLAAHRGSHFAECIRSLNASIGFSRSDHGARAILVTSANPKEGKSTIALCLAQERALAGHLAVVMDSDFRRPSIHDAFDISQSPGLLDLLTGNATLSEALKHDEATGLYILPAGTSRAGPSPDMLGTARMQKLMHVLRGSFDFVFIDSPPMLAVSDSRLLARMVDTTVFVVRWGRTKRRSVRLCIDQILASGGHFAGVVLSMVDVKRHSRYGSSDSEYFTRSVRKYYSR